MKFLALVLFISAGAVCADASSPFAKVGTATTAGSRHYSQQQERQLKQIEEIPGRIEYWVDGDTCDFTPDKTNKMIRVRLWLVDAPESKQKGGKEATKYMIHHPKVGRGKHVILGKVGFDEYNRTLGQLKGDKEGDEYITEELLGSGYFWPYYPALQHDISQEEEKRLKRIFNATKSAKKGIFEDDDAEPPYIWRRKHPRDN